MSSTDSDRYAVSRDTVTAGLFFTAAHAPTPLYYVFGDLKVLTPAEVVHYTAHALRHRSGAFHLVYAARLFEAQEAGESDQRLKEIAAEALKEVYFQDNGRRAGQLEEVRLTDIEHLEFDL